MATGQGLIASAIQRNNQSALEADRGMREGFALYDRRRSNRVQEALAREGQSIQREGLDLQREGINVNREQLSNQRRGQDIQMALGEKGLVAEGRRTAVAEGQLALQREQQDIENRMQYKETGDKYGKVFVNMFDDMTSQQKELLAKKKELIAENNKLDGVTKDASKYDKEVLKIDKQLEANQARWERTTKMMLSPSMKAMLTYSTVPVEDVILNMFSPYDKAKMSEEELAASAQAQTDAINMMYKARTALEEEDYKIMTDRVIAAEGGKARAVAEGQLEVNKALIEAKGAEDRKLWETKGAIEAQAKGGKDGRDATIKTAYNHVKTMENRLRSLINDDKFEILSENFNSAAIDYYDQFPQDWSADFAHISYVFEKLAQNKNDAAWLQTNVPLLIEDVMYGNKQAGIPGLSTNYDTSNPFIPLLNSLDIIGKNKIWNKKDTAGMLSKISNDWIALTQAGIMPTPEATSTNGVPSIPQQ